MKLLTFKTFFLLASLCAVAGNAGAEDIDVYAGGSSNAQPNLLVLMDNSGAWSASSPTNDGAANGCPLEGGVSVIRPSIQNTSGGVEACGLYRAVQAIAATPSLIDKIRMGLMLFRRQNIQGGRLWVPNVTTFSPTATEAQLPLMDAAGIQRMQDFIKTLEGSGSDNNTANGTDVGGAMQEAWAYYTGNTGISGTTYPGLDQNAICGKKFVLFIGISRTSSNPNDSNSNNVFDKLRTAVGSDATEQARYLPYIPASPLGVDDNYMKANSDRWGDEWARFNKQRHDIITYTITLRDPANPNPSYDRFMQSMADEGGGINFKVNLGDMDALVQALLRVFNEVQAVDSVFASASLPISANAQGTFLNQVFMGMFRPDALGRPRWLGNLKQYQFGVDANKNLYLGDSTKLTALPSPNPNNLVLGQPTPAISSDGSGFIAPKAVSFWTSKDTSTTPDSFTPTGGFWRKVPDGEGLGFDSPDGELIEKGGVGQQIRIDNKTVDYIASPAGPRRLYTCLGTSCTANAALSGMPFATTNADLTAAALGVTNPSFTANVTKFERSSATNKVTITLAAAASPAIADPTTIVGSGSSNGQYNHALLNQSPTVVSGTSITYNIPAVTPPVSPADPTAYVATGLGSVAGTPSNVNSLTRTSNAGRITVTADLADPTFGGGTPVAVNDVFSITASSGYNGSGYIVTGVTGTTVTFTMTDAPGVYGGGGDIWVGASCQKTGPASGRNCDGIGASNSNAPGAGTLPGLVRGVGAAPTAPDSSPTSHVLMVNFTAGAGGSSITSFLPGASAKIQGATSSLYNSTSGYKILTVGSDCRVDVVDPTSGLTRQYIGTPSTGGKVYSLCLDLGTTGSGFSNTPALSGNGATAGTTKATRTSGSIQRAITNMTRSAATCPTSNIATVTVTTAIDHGFANNSSVNIGTSNQGPDEGAYNGNFTITTAGGNTFTFPVPTAPACTDTTAGMKITYQASAGGTDYRDLIRWVRGADNVGDERGPGSPINIRPSVHGDVLHSRPAVINYGGTTGIVVFYGSNDGVFRAINGNQNKVGDPSFGAITSPASPSGTVSVRPGGELWGFVAPEFYSKFERLYKNSPVIQLSNTSLSIVPTPTPRGYFFDGGTGIYQDIDSGKTYLFLSARRGGRLIYALDVSDPTTPKFLWKKTNVDLPELGQTWSTPKVALVKGHVDGSGNPKPVLIFGAGYDPAEDNATTPPDAASRTMGRGIFILDALTGALLWEAGPGGATNECTGTPCRLQDMTYAIPADVTLLDRNPDGLIDRIYVSDIGGNVWRVDLEPPAGNAPANWQVTKLAALGGSTATKRKMFFSPDVVATKNFDAVLIGTGDREHPTLANAQSSQIVDRFYMLKDLNTDSSAAGWTPIQDNTSSTTDDVPPDLFNATTTPYDQTLKGFYLTLKNVVTVDQPKTGEIGEKVVNAPTTVGGRTFFGTNTPQPPEAGVCKPNLGTARGYSVDFITGNVRFSEFAGGGLPPSPVAGLVSIDVDGDGIEELVPFLIGGDCPPGTGGPDCSPLGAQKPPVEITPTRTRTYWYRAHDK